MIDRRAATLVAVMAIASLMGAAPSDTAVITNSGSTNSLGYTIKITPDGHATVQTQSKGGSPSAEKAFTVPAETAARFFADLAAARKAGGTSEPCMKSASFGTTTHVAWQDWESPDLDCPPATATATALVNDVQEIRKASGVPAMPLIQH